MLNKAKVGLVWFLGGVWILSILVFIITLIVATNFFRGTVDSTNFGNSIYFIPLFLGSISVGSISFFLMIIAILVKSFLKKGKKAKIQKESNNDDDSMKTVWKSTWVGVFILLGIIGFLNYKQESLLANQRKETYRVITTSSPIPSPTLTPSPTVKPKPAYVDPDPVINCNISSNCGGGTKQMKKSDCEQLTCCELAKNSWSNYPNKTSCTQAQNNYNSARTNGTSNSYPPCTVFYPLSNYSFTYKYLSPSECLSTQAKANSYKTTETPPIATIAPYVAPTTDPATQALLDEHARLCVQAVGEWYTQVEQFNANEYNNFNSSTEAIMELERRRQAYQQELYSAGCTQTIYLYR